MKKAGDFELCAKRLKALADPKRLRIVCCLFSGTKNVGDLAAQLDDEIVMVSHHLGVLRHAGLVQAHKSGRFVEYTLHPDVVRSIQRSDQSKFIDLGCCRLDLGEE
jgi:ArsR family transcriptional regulator